MKTERDAGTPLLGNQIILDAQGLINMDSSVIDILKNPNGWDVSIRGGKDRYAFADIKQAEKFARSYAAVMNIYRIQLRESATASTVIFLNSRAVI